MLDTIVTTPATSQGLPDRDVTAMRTVTIDTMVTTPASPAHERLSAVDRKVQLYAILEVSNCGSLFQVGPQTTSVLGEKDKLVQTQIAYLRSL